MAKRPAPDDLLSRAEVAELLGVAPSSISVYSTRGEFPEPDKIFGRSRAWRRDTIEAWRASRPGKGVGGGRPAAEAIKAGKAIPTRAPKAVREAAAVKTPRQRVSS